MALNPEIRDQAYQFFIEEAQELLQVIEEGLLNLKQDYSTPKIHELMRAAHSIKGGAASVELDAITNLAHRLEDFFKALYSDQVNYDSELEGLLLQAYDCLRHPLTEQMQQGSFDADAALANAESVFLQLERRLGDALKNADNYIPSSTDLGIDIVSSIFEVDVTESLERLNKVLANPQNYEVTGEIRTQAEVFSGFAQLLNLPGFGEIAETTLTALELHPEETLEILALMIIDCQAAQQVVLAGDRDRGGEPSEALLALAQSNQLDSNAATEASASEDISFDEIFSTPLDNSLSTNSESESNLVTFDAVPSLDDVFGNSVEEAVPEVTSEPSLIVETFSEFEPILDDVFGGSIEDIAPEIITSEPSLIPETSYETEPSLDDVFGGSVEEIALETITSDAATIVETVNETEPSLDDVFGESLEEIATETSLESEPNFENIWGTVEDNSGIEVSEVEVEIVSTKNNSEEIPQPENLVSAVESIGQIFDQLSSLAENPESLSVLSTPKSVPPSQNIKKKSSSSIKNQASNVSNLTIRVDLARLERMNNLIGELVINRNSLSLQNKQLQGNVKDLVQKFARFRQVTGKLRELSDQMLVESEHITREKLSQIKPQKALISLSQNGQQTSEELLAQRSPEFDSLEMDNYSQLHSSLQGVLEELMQLEESVDDIVLFARASDRTVEQQRQMLGQMRDELMWARMLPLEQILQRFPRVLRDLCHQYGKSVSLNLFGTGVLVDKVVLEKLYDPLLHLLRNAFDHGIEPPDIRRQQGKSEEGQITIHAYYQGNQTIIQIKDDGQGINLSKVAQKAVKQGLISLQQAKLASKEELFELIFEPGFSTASKVSELSGRGVGMNVVRSQLEALKGTVTVASNVGQGTTFTLSLPLTLTIAKLLVCACGSTALAFPSDSIEEIIIPTVTEIKLSNRQKFLIWHEQLVPIYPLGNLLQYNCILPPEKLNNKNLETITSPADWALPLLLLRQGQHLYAIEVEQLITEQELVIKPFSKTLTAPSYIYGCTILGDGTLIPAINGSILITEILGEEAHTRTNQNTVQSELRSSQLESIEDIEPSFAFAKQTGLEQPKTQIFPSQKSQTILVVDDSAALRRTMALSLEKQGYRVLQARDGREALAQLNTSIKIDLVVCDIEMPNMNGFEFLTMRRQDSQLAEIPVVMLTSRSGEKHRTLALQLGANQYFTKPYIEQEFLQQIKKILQTNSQQSPRQTASGTKSGKNKTILIIDDSSALRRTMALSLEKQGYRVLQARDGQEGLNQLRQHSQINLVICDIEMPNMNGFEFLTSRRQEPQLITIPVAMLTSRNSEKHRNLAKQLGAVGYFTKPYVEEQFFQEIAKLIK